MFFFSVLIIYLVISCIDCSMFDIITYWLNVNACIHVLFITFIYLMHLWNVVTIISHHSQGYLISGLLENVFTIEIGRCRVKWWIVWEIGRRQPVFSKISFYAIVDFHYSAATFWSLLKYGIFHLARGIENPRERPGGSVARGEGGRALAPVPWLPLWSNGLFCFTDEYRLNLVL